MDLTAHYCQSRRNIEERSWALVERLFRLTTHLNDLIGQHDAFEAMKLKCIDARGELKVLRKRLLDHREAHHC